MKSLTVALFVLLMLFGVVLLLKSNSEQSPGGHIDVERSVASTTTDRDSPSESMKTFTDKRGNYRISYPRTWRLDDKTSSNHMIRADIVKNEDFGFQIRAFSGIQDSLEDFSDHFIEQFMADMSGHWQGDIREDDRQCFSGASQDRCISSIIFARADGKAWFFREYLFQRADRVIVLQCGCRLEDRSANERELDAIAATFAFLR